jgi:pimeloyl-ACP methyl ester carboxylesterase
VSGEAFLRGFVEYWSGAGAWDGLREEARAEFTRAARVIHDGAEALVGDRTPLEAYRGLRAPALLITGSHTPPAERLVVRRLAEGIPGAKVVVVEGAGHMGPLTHTAVVNDAILGHLRG